MPTSPHSAVILIWAGLMLALSVLVGAFGAPPTTSPLMFVAMVAGGAIANLGITALMTAVPVYLRQRRDKPTSFGTTMLFFTLAWPVATALQLLGVFLISESGRPAT